MLHGRGKRNGAEMIWRRTNRASIYLLHHRLFPVRTIRRLRPPFRTFAKYAPFRTTTYRVPQCSITGNSHGPECYRL